MSHFASGVIREGESYLVGPLLDGRFLPAKITTIHRYRVPRRMVRAAQAASIRLRSPWLLLLRLVPDASLC